MCISHTLNNVGNRISFDVLEEFMLPWLELVGGRNPHRGAQSLWRAKVAPQKVPGFSNVRWYCKAEIQFVLAENFEKLQQFLLELDARGYGEATRQKLHDILDADCRRTRLKLQLAAMLDLRDLVRYTYQLEGDGLELLIVWERIEHLRALGRSIAAGGDGVLRNVDAVLRANLKLRNGVKIQKVICIKVFFSPTHPLLSAVCSSLKALATARLRSSGRILWRRTCIMGMLQGPTRCSTQWTTPSRSSRRKKFALSSS